MSNSSRVSSSSGVPAAGSSLRSQEEQPEAEHVVVATGERSGPLEAGGEAEAACGHGVVGEAEADERPDSLRVGRRRVLAPQHLLERKPRPSVPRSVLPSKQVNEALWWKAPIAARPLPRRSLPPPVSASIA